MKKESLFENDAQEVEQENVDTAVATVNNGNGALAQSFDLSGDLPDLYEDTEETNYDLTSDYWTPEKPGEFKMVLFWEFRTREVRDINDSDVVADLECAYLIEQKPDKSTQVVCNGSKRLVGTLKEANLAPGSPLKIVYEGKKKNKSNNFSSDAWKVIPLKVKSK